METFLNPKENKENRMKADKPNPHRRTRAAHASETAEDYVEAAYDVIAEKNTCRVQDLADHFAVSHVTVSRIVGRLCDSGLMTTAPYRPIELTAEGESLARRSKKRHETVYQFLLAIGVKPETAMIDSEGMEHHVSDATLSAMKRLMKKLSAE